MSIRRALLAVLVLASVAFGAAVAALGAVFLSRDAVRLEAARASVLEQAQAVSAVLEANPGLSAEALRPKFRATLAAAQGVFAGVCAPHGPEVLVSPDPPPPGDERGPPPEPAAPGAAGSRW